MTQSGETPPTKGPGAPHLPPGIGEGDKAKLNFKMSLSAVFAELFEAVSGLYLTVTNGDLQTLNSELNRATNYLARIGKQIADTPSKCTKQLQELKNMQQQAQTNISGINVTQNSMVSAAASLATVLGKVVDTVQALLTSVSANW